MKSFITGFVASVSTFLMSPVAQAVAVCRVNGEVVKCPDVSTVAGGGILLLIIGFLGFVAVTFLFVLWIMMLIHAIKNPIKEKALWIIILILGQGLGAIIYYFAVKRHFVTGTTINPVTPVPPPQAPTAPPAA